jgi:hypothetical protein
MQNGKDNPLVGKILRFDCDDGAAYSVSRFVADLGSNLYLMRRVSPHNFRDLAVSHVLNLLHIANDEMAEIYDDINAYKKDMDVRPNVMKLVGPAQEH